MRKADLRAQVATPPAVFGSVAQDEPGSDSDIEVLVDLDPAVVVTTLDYAGVKDYVASLCREPVDVIDKDALKPRLRPRIAKDAINAF